MVPFFSSLKAYFIEYSLAGGEQLDTGVSAEQYVCGIVGLQALNGDIEESDRGDILKAYAFTQFSESAGRNTWWVTANFRTHHRNEKWQLNFICLDRASENKVFIYRDDYRGSPGGEAVVTDISTEDYYYCGIIGMAALDGDIQESDVRDIIVQAYMDGSESKWKIVAEFATHRVNEKWNFNVLCLSRGSTLASEKPAFITQTLYNLSGTDHEMGTGISFADYLCGVTGMSAERGDIEEYDSRDIIRVFMHPQDGIWYWYANFATHHKDEDWRGDILCINRDFASEGLPSP
jgi:hypothetical protein